MLPLRIHMFLDLPDPDLLFRDMDPDPSIVRQKKLENFWFLLLCDLFYYFLSLNNDVNVPSKNNKQQNLEIKIIFC